MFAMPVRRIFLAMLASSALACTVHRDAAALMQKHRYDEAADAYGAILTKNPKDPEAGSALPQARAAAVQAWVEKAEQAGRAGATAELAGALQAALERCDRWSLSRKPELAARINAAAAMLASQVSVELKSLAGAGRLLEAQALLERQRAVLGRAEFRAELGPLQAQFAGAVAARCGELRTAVSTPYLSHVAARYCRQLGVDAPPVGALPEQRGHLEVRVSGMAEQDAGRLRAALDSQFQGSPWYAERAPAPAGAVAVKHTTKEDARPERLTKAYTVQVPYTVMQTRSEMYQEPYSAMENYTESVPYTTYQTYTYSCGTYQSPRTCTGSRPMTQYRQEMRTRTVTKYRTATRMVTVPVTLSRTEGRQVQYDATARQVAFASEMSLQLELPGAPKLVVKHTAALGDTEHEHAMNLAEADLHAQPRKLPTPEQWVAQQEQELARKLGDELSRSWSAAFCSAQTFTLEEAARCAYGSGTPPAAVGQALAQKLGDDGARLAALAAWR